MTKYKWQKDRQYNDKIKMTEGQTIQKQNKNDRRTDNTMTK